MTKLEIEQKRKIDNFVLDAACADFKHISAPYISRLERLDIKTVRTRLLQLKFDDRIIINYDIICPECFQVIKTVHDEKDIPLDDTLSCDEHGDFVVESNYVLINYSPNKEYYTDEICSRHVKKNLRETY